MYIKTMNVNIRQFHSFDISKINKIFKQTLSSHIENMPDLFCSLDENNNWNSQFLKKISENNTGIVFVAEISREVVGYIISYLQKFPMNAPFYKARKVLYIEDISIEEQYQNKGIGTLLISKCEKWAKKNGFTDIELNVYESNQRAQSFYHKLGYKTLSRTFIKKL